MIYEWDINNLFHISTHVDDNYYANLHYELDFEFTPSLYTDLVPVEEFTL